MKELSVGQKKFLAEFLGNFAIAWLVGAVVSPFFSGALLIETWRLNIMAGAGIAGIFLFWAFVTVKEVES